MGKVYLFISKSLYTQQNDKPVLQDNVKSEREKSEPLTVKLSDTDFNQKQYVISPSTTHCRLTSQGSV